MKYKVKIIAQKIEFFPLSYPSNERQNFKMSVRNKGVKFFFKKENRCIKINFIR